MVRCQHLGISENVANLVLQRMFLESPSKVTAASEDSGPATSKGGMPNKKAKAEACSMPPPKAPTTAKKRPEPTAVEPAVVEPGLAPKVETKSEAPSATYRTQHNPELGKNVQLRQSARSPDEEDTQVWHRGATQEPVPQAPSAINNYNRPPLRVACFRPTGHHQLV